MNFRFGIKIAGLVLLIASCARNTENPDSGRGTSDTPAVPARNQGPTGGAEAIAAVERIEPIPESAFEFFPAYPLSESTLPKVERGESGFYVEYKDTYYQSHVEGVPGAHQRGYSTEVIRFPTPPAEGEDAARSVWISQLRSEGERQAYRYLLQRGAGYLRVTALKAEAEPEAFKIFLRDSEARIEAQDFVEEISLDGNGDLKIAFSHAGAMEPRWIWSSRFGGAYACLDGGKIVIDGRFEGGIEKPTRYVERPRREPGGGGDTEIDFAYPPEGIWIRANGVEPINECLFVGLDEWLQDGDLLERYAIASIVLRYHAGLKPVLAAAVLRARRTGSSASVSLDGRREGRP